MTPSLFAPIGRGRNDTPCRSPGSTQHRLKTDQTGYNNLYIVGDWIENGFNSGCIEASTMSGMQASRAICGYPVKIVGEDSVDWLGD